MKSDIQPLAEDYPPYLVRGTDTNDKPSATDGLIARLQAANAANPLPPDYFAKRVERNIQRMIDAGNEILDTTGEDAEPVKPTRNRKPTVAQVIRQMQRAGVDARAAHEIVGAVVAQRADDLGHSAIDHLVRGGH
jgi:hypothetical protein